MAHHVDPDVLKQLRQRASLTQEALAKRTRLNEQTVHRLESGRGPARQRQSTVEKLCAALGTDAETLAGRKPLGRDPSSESPDLERIQLNVRIGRPVRNAFSLVAQRYGVPVTRIVEYAPLLLAILAEQSLAQRREKLAEVEALIERARERRATSFPYLPAAAAGFFDYDATAAERQSIDRCDVFGKHIDHEFLDPRDAEEKGPFTGFLKELASSLVEPIEVRGFDAWTRPYEVCRADVVGLVGGDEESVRAILDGWVQLHEMPAALRTGRDVAARIEWVREKLEAHRAERSADPEVQRIDKLLDEWSGREQAHVAGEQP